MFLHKFETLTLILCFQILLPLAILAFVSCWWFGTSLCQVNSYPMGILLSPFRKCWVWQACCVASLRGPHTLSSNMRFLYLHFKYHLYGPFHYYFIYLYYYSFMFCYFFFFSLLFSIFIIIIIILIIFIIIFIYIHLFLCLGGVLQYFHSFAFALYILSTLMHFLIGTLYSI